MSRAHYVVWNIGMGESGLVGNFTPCRAATCPERQVRRTARTPDAEGAQAVQADARIEWHIVERFAGTPKARRVDFDEIVEIFKEFGKPPKIIPDGPYNGFPGPAGGRFAQIVLNHYD